jgi:hypothetical protein
MLTLYILITKNIEMVKKWGSQPFGDHIPQNEQNFFGVPPNPEFYATAYHKNKLFHLKDTT